MPKLSILSSLEKVFPQGPIPKPLRKFSMLKNERSSFQAAFYAEKDCRASVRISSPLAPCISLFQVEAIPAAAAAPKDADRYYITKTGGLFPDLLRPVENGTVSLRGGENNALWFEIRGDLPAGTFPVEVTVDLGDACLTGSLTVTVMDALLPEQKLIFTNWFHTDCLATYYNVPVFSEEYWRITENYLRRAAEFGMNMVLTPLFTPPLDTAVGGQRPTVQLVDVTVTGPGQYAFGFANLDRWVAMARRCGIRYFELSHFFTQWGAQHAPKVMASTEEGEKRIFGWETDAFGPEYGAFLRQLGAALIPHLEGLGIRDKCLVHVSDEPSQDQLPAYRAASALVHESFPGFPAIDALSDFNFYQEKLVDTPIPASSAIDPFIGRVPQLWTYYCCSQGRHYESNRFFAMPSQRNRVLGFQLYKFHAVGFLHWAFNFWYAQFSTRAIDPFTETDAGGGFPAGDAFVVYPGPGGQPMSSLRLHVFYDGFQDLRALELLESLAGRKKAMSILDPLGLLTFRRYPRSARWQLRTREKINRAIARSSGCFER